MIHELRAYRCMPGRLPDLLSRLEGHTLRIWEKHGIRPLGVWTTEAGEGDQQLTYMLAWDSLAEREKRWNAFLTDPERIANLVETEQAGSFVRHISNQLLTPALLPPARR
jgi:hypothetical protein